MSKSFTVRNLNSKVCLLYLVTILLNFMFLSANFTYAASTRDAEDECPPKESVVDRRMSIRMPINYQHCLSMPTMQGCPEYMKKYEACRPKRKKLLTTLPYPETMPTLEEQSKMGYCTGQYYETQEVDKKTGEQVTVQHRRYKLVVMDSSPKSPGRSKESGDYKYLYSFLDPRDPSGVYKDGNEIKKCSENKIYQLDKVNERYINTPNLYFNKGERAEIEIENYSQESITIHWHGLLLKNEMDGTEVTQASIPPKSKDNNGTFKYEFNLIQDGTYWYHPHSDLHEQHLRGAFVIFDEYDPIFQEDTTKYHHDRVVLMNDFKPEDPRKILNRLQLGMNQYAQESRNYIDLYSAVKTAGLDGFIRYFDNLKSMGMANMDKADVWYKSFFVNNSDCLNCGKLRNKLVKPSDTPAADDENYKFKKGERVRLRLINGSASSYFYVNYANEMDERFDPEHTSEEEKKLMEGRKHPMIIIAKDGRPIVPLETDQLLMGMGETYDVLVEITEDNTAYELMIKSYDDLRSERLSRILMGAPTDNLDTKVIRARNTPVFLWGLGTNDGIFTQPHYSQMQSLMNQNPYTPAGDVAIETKELQQFNLRLNGNMEKYKWQILQDTKADKVTNSKYKLEYDAHGMPFLTVPTGKRVRMNFENTMIEGMMNHPLHLHGTYFRLAQPKQSAEEIWKGAEIHTANIFPDEKLSLEFYVPTKEEDPLSQGCWMFHCHNLYHMANSMMMYIVTEGAKCPAMEQMHSHNHEKMLSSNSSSQDMNGHSSDNAEMNSANGNYGNSSTRPMGALNPMGLKGQIIQFLAGAGVSNGGFSQNVGFMGAASNDNKGHLYFKGDLARTSQVFHTDDPTSWEAVGEINYCVSSNRCANLTLQHQRDKVKGENASNKMTVYVGSTYQNYINPLLSLFQFKTGIGAEVKYGKDQSTSTLPAFMVESSLSLPLLPKTIGELSVGCEGAYCKEFFAKFRGEYSSPYLVAEPEVGATTEEGLFTRFNLTIRTDPVPLR